jgi:anti-sigma factor (TIGR02949 family)
MAAVDRYTCLEVLSRLDDYVDRELSAEEMGRVSEHLESCEVCLAEHRFESSLLREIPPKLERIAAPVDLIDRISRAIGEAARA